MTVLTESGEFDSLKKCQWGFSTQLGVETSTIIRHDLGKSKESMIGTAIAVHSQVKV